MSNDRYTITPNDLRAAAEMFKQCRRGEAPVMPLYEWEVPRFASIFRRMGYRVQVIPRKVGDEGYTLEPLHATDDPDIKGRNNED